MRRSESLVKMACTGLTLIAFSGTAGAVDVSAIEKRRLFEPTEAELRQEAKGRIYIFDGVSDADIARAMDEEFARVQSMMFIRVKKTNENGEVLRNPDTGTAVVQDDGC